MEGRIKRLEREWDHPAHPGPDPETVAHWASLWTAVGIEESRATAFALEFLAYCRTTGQEVAWSTLLTREKGGEDGDGSGEGLRDAVHRRGVRTVAVTVSQRNVPNQSAGAGKHEVDVQWRSKN